MRDSHYFGIQLNFASIEVIAPSVTRYYHTVFYLFLNSYFYPGFHPCGQAGLLSHGRCHKCHAAFALVPFNSSSSQEMPRLEQTEVLKVDGIERFVIESGTVVVINNCAY